MFLYFCFRKIPFGLINEIFYVQSNTNKFLKEGSPEIVQFTIIFLMKQLLSTVHEIDTKIIGIILLCDP